MKYIVTKMRRFCGFLAGIIFYISGILKLLDPVGAGLVMDEYFSFMHIGFMDFSAKFLGFGDHIQRNIQSDQDLADRCIMPPHQQPHIIKCFRRFCRCNTMNNVFNLPYRYGHARVPP